jgi:hypothetical protein
VALIEEGQAAGLLRQDIAAVALLTIILGSLNYAQIVRPTFSRAFTEPPSRATATGCSASLPMYYYSSALQASP